MAKGHGISGGSVIKWTLIAAVVYVVYRLVTGWAAGLGTSSAAGSATTPVNTSSYASPGGYTSPISGALPISGYGFNPLPSASAPSSGGLFPLPLPIVSKPFNGRLI